MCTPFNEWNEMDVGLRGRGVWVIALHMSNILNICMDLDGTQSRCTDRHWNTRRNHAYLLLKRVFGFRFMFMVISCLMLYFLVLSQSTLLLHLLRGRLVRGSFPFLVKANNKRNYSILNIKRKIASDIATPAKP